MQYISAASGGFVEPRWKTQFEKTLFTVIPAQAGIQNNGGGLDSRLRACRFNRGIGFQPVVMVNEVDLIIKAGEA